MPEFQNHPKDSPTYSEIKSHIANIIPPIDFSRLSPAFKDSVTIETNLKQKFAPELQLPDGEVGEGTIAGFSLIFHKAKLNNFAHLYPIITTPMIELAIDELDIYDEDTEEPQLPSTLLDFPFLQNKEYNTPFGKGLKIAFKVHEHIMMVSEQKQEEDNQIQENKESTPVLRLKEVTSEPLTAPTKPRQYSKLSPTQISFIETALALKMNISSIKDLNCLGAKLNDHTSLIELIQTIAPGDVPQDLVQSLQDYTIYWNKDGVFLTNNNS